MRKRGGKLQVKLRSCFVFLLVFWKLSAQDELCTFALSGNNQLCTSPVSQLERAAPKLENYLLFPLILPFANYLAHRHLQLMRLVPVFPSTPPHAKVLVPPLHLLLLLLLHVQGQKEGVGSSEELYIYVYFISSPNSICQRKHRIGRKCNVRNLWK